MKMDDSKRDASDLRVTHCSLGHSNAACTTKVTDRIVNTALLGGTDWGCSL